jgi:hypothetical protein
MPYRKSATVSPHHAVGAMYNVRKSVIFICLSGRSADHPHNEVAATVDRGWVTSEDVERSDDEGHCERRIAVTETEIAMPIRNIEIV